MLNKGTPIWQSILSLSPIAAAIGYLMAYLYELGYCQSFGIPSDFIQLPTTNIITSIGKVFLSFLMLFWLIGMFIVYSNDPKRNTPSPIKRRFIILAFMVLSYLGFAMGYKLAILQWYYAITFPITFIIFFFVVPLFTQMKVSGYINKLIAEDKAMAQAPFPLLDYMFNTIGRTATTALIFSLILLLGLPYFSGQNAALTQNTFLIPSINPNAVVLRIYGNEAICAQINQNQKPEYFLIRLDQDPTITLSYQKFTPMIDILRTR